MAIREQIRRALRRSDESDNTHTETTTTTSSSKASVSSKSSGSRLTRTWTWGSNKDKESKPRKPKNKNKTKRRIVHPSERPLTEQNLRHQEMLSQFTWTFGTTRPDQLESDSFIGISPCCTRANSLIDYDPSSDSDGSSSSQDSRLSQPFH